MDKNLTIDVIKELSSQLQLLYGHAASDILPIVLRAISIKSTFNILGNIAAILTVLILVKYMWVPGIEKAKQEVEDQQEFVPFVRYIGMFLATLSAPLFIGYTIASIAHIFAPEIMIIDKILE